MKTFYHFCGHPEISSSEITRDRESQWSEYSHQLSVGVAVVVVVRLDANDKSRPDAITGILLVLVPRPKQ